MISFNIPKFAYLTAVMKIPLKDVIYTKRLRVSTSLLDNSMAFHKEYSINVKF